MPTDGADFGRMKACYGKVYTAVRTGVTPDGIAGALVRGIEREIRHAGGVPAFVPAVELIAATLPKMEEGRALKFLEAIDALARAHADSSLTRLALEAALKVGLAALCHDQPLPRHEIAKRILAGIAESRGDATSAYATRHRTHSAAETQELLGSVRREVAIAPSLDGLAGRMLKSSPKGLPERAPRGPRIMHSPESLNNISLEEEA